MLIDGGKAKRQPVVDNDIVLAVNRILQMEESKGQIYELGGSHVYTFKELMEFIGNNLNRRPFYIDYSYEDFMKLYLSPNSNWEKAANWVKIRPDSLVQMRKDNLIIKKQGVKTFEDLNIIPLATHHTISDLCNWLIQKVTIESYDNRSIAELEGHDD
jgi:hypothetical protein